MNMIHQRLVPNQDKKYRLQTAKEIADSIFCQMGEDLTNERERLLQVVTEVVERRHKNWIARYNRMLKARGDRIRERILNARRMCKLRLEDHLTEMRMGKKE